MRAARLLVGVLALTACSESTAPTVDCQGALEVTVVVTRLGADTTVACVFPEPPPPDGDHCDRDHGHGHGRHHRHGHHDHHGGRDG